MAKQIHQPYVFLERPLYLFDLPSELLPSLRSQHAGDGLVEVDREAASTDYSTRPSRDDSTQSATSCTMCQSSFSDFIEQREHARSDFHRYNLKLHLKGLSVVDETTFNKLIGDLDESISASDSSESISDADGCNEMSQDSALAALAQRKAKISPNPDEDVPPTKRDRAIPGNPPLLWLTSSQLPENVSLGVYKALLRDSERKQDLAEVIRQKQLGPAQPKDRGSHGFSGASITVGRSPHYFLCMMGGGHFAAMIVSLVAEIRKSPKGHEERHLIVKAHQTFHRYTTRRKQGGAQSANDNAKGNAHSAGSSIRRYNEAALQLDIRRVLYEWKTMIDEAELLFIRATGTTSRRTLYGPSDKQVFRADDPRIRGFPFSTRRATQAELTKSFKILTRLKVSTVSHAVLEQAQAGEGPAKEEKSQSSVPNSVPQLSKEEEALILHTSQIQTLIRRSKVPALMTYFTKNKLSPDLSFHPSDAPQNHHAPTALHLAASTNSAALVLALLTQAKADPTLHNGDGKTAFLLAGDSKTRDAFRNARYQLGDSAVDWKAAKVPSALSERETRDRQQQDESQEHAAEARRRQSDLRRILEKEEAQQVGKIEGRLGAGHILSGREKTGAERREEEGRGLTPETRMRLERERRARAAEERIKKIQGGN